MSATRAVPLSPGRDASDEVTSLMHRWHDDGDVGARDELVARFTPLALRLARRYNSPYEPFDDLAQVALIGLLGAINRFDPDRGAAFPSFAIPTVLGELKRYFRTTGWSVHVPRGVQELSLRVDRASRHLARELGRPPTATQVAEHLEITLDDVLVALEATTAHYAVSLDAPVHSGEDEDSGATLGERLGGDEHGFGLADTKLALAATLRILPYQERRALALRVGENLKQSEIAEVLQCSQMQVSRLLRRAAERVRELTDPALAGG